MVEETHRFATLGFQLQEIDCVVETAMEDPEVLKRERSVTEALVQSWSPNWKEIPVPGAGIGVISEVSDVSERRGYADPMRLNWATISNPQPLFSLKNPSRVATIIFLMAGFANASVIDDILNNLGSDLAPLVSLFGEKPTVQYLSQSLTPIDNFIFALAPVGIITAIVCAIRVGGGLGLRSFIGRALESWSVVGAELMSSTSSDVCEMWDGQAIVRVTGTPVLLQLIYFPVPPTETASSEGSSRLYTLPEAVEKHFYEANKGEKVSESNPILSNPPNILFNLHIGQRREGPLLVAGIVGTTLQASVLVFAALIQYRVINITGDPIPVYAVYVLVSGTILLAIGMFLCARVIERSTEELSWEPTPGQSTGIKVIWLQQGGESVGGQVSGTFGKLLEKSTIMTSTKRKEPTGNLKEKARRVPVVFALGFSLVGFAAQFVGFRSTHSYVTLAQLAVVLIMIGIRSSVHTGVVVKNDIIEPGKLGDGQELDWLAKKLGECSRWEVVVGLSNSHYPKYVEAKALEVEDSEVEDSEVEDPEVEDLNTNALEAGILEVKTSDTKDLDTEDPEAEDPEVKNLATLQDMVTKVMETRARLAMLSSSWELKNRETVVSLKNAIEKTMDYVCTGMLVELGEEMSERFEWSLNIRAVAMEVDKKPPREELRKVKLALTREKDGQNPWETSKHDLEAVLCLWISSLQETKLSKVLGKKLPGCVRLLGEATDEQAEKDYELWIDHETELNKSLDTPEESIYFGWTGHEFEKEKKPVLNVDAKEDIEALCAQEIYTSFMFQLGSRFKVIQGETFPRMGSSGAANSWKPNIPSTESFGLNNTILASLADLLFSSGLGSIENAYLCIIPALRASDKLPAQNEALMEIRDIWPVEGRKKSKLSTPESFELFKRVSKAGLYKAVEWLLLASVSPNTHPWGSPGRTVLQAAAEVGHDKVVQLLLDHGANVSARPAKVSGRTAMQAAAGGGHVNIVNLLLTNGADINELPAKISGRTAMQAAVDGGQNKIIELLLNEGASVGEPPAEKSGLTAMQAAAGSGHNKTVNLLLHKGADANEKPAKKKGCTALYAAVEKNHVPIVKLLLERGAEIDFCLEKGKTLLTAVEAGYKDVVKLLVQKGADVELSVFEGAMNGGRVQMLRDVGLDIAAEGGSEGIVQLLLGSMENISVYDCENALQVAEKANHEKIARLLKEEIERLLLESKETTPQPLAPPAIQTTQKQETHQQATTYTENQGGGHDNTNPVTSEAGIGVDSPPTSAGGSMTIQATTNAPKVSQPTKVAAGKAVSSLSSAGANTASPVAPGGRLGPASGSDATKGSHGGSHSSSSNTRLSASSPPGTKGGLTRPQAAEDNREGAHTLSSNARPSASSPSVMEGEQTTSKTGAGGDRGVDSPASDAGPNTDPLLKTIEEQTLPE